MSEELRSNSRRTADPTIPQASWPARMVSIAHTAPPGVSGRKRRPGPSGGGREDDIGEGRPEPVYRGLRRLGRRRGVVALAALDAAVFEVARGRIGVRSSVRLLEQLLRGRFGVVH